MIKFLNGCLCILLLLPFAAYSDSSERSPGPVPDFDPVLLAKQTKETTANSSFSAAGRAQVGPVNTGGQPFNANQTSVAVGKTEVDVSFFLRSEYFALSEKEDIFVHRAQIYPSISFGAVTIGLDQRFKIKEIKENVQKNIPGGYSDVSLSKGQAYIEPRRDIRLPWGVSLSPRAQYWVPSGKSEREKDGAFGGPGLSLYAKKYFSAFKISAVLSARKMFFDQRVRSFNEDYSNFNEIALKWYINKLWYAQAKWQWINSWNQLGQFSAISELRQTVGIKVNRNFSIEAGHEHGQVLYTGNGQQLDIASADNSAFFSRLRLFY